MTRALHTGRAGSRVIPEGWAAAHRPTIATSWNGAVEIRDPDATTIQAWSDADQQMHATLPEPHYRGPARVQQLTTAGAQRVIVGEDPEQVADYLVVVDADLEVPEGHLVKVTAADDPQLEGSELVVVRTALGTERWERDLFCTLLT